MAETKMKVFPTTTALVAAAAQFVIAAAEAKFVDVHNIFSLVLASGATSNAQRLAEVLKGPAELSLLPIQSIRPWGRLTWLLDGAAAALLRET